MEFNLNPAETKIYDGLNTPQKIQEFLNRMPINFERSGETLYSPRLALQKNRAHCIEAALFAASVLWYHGQKPLLLDLVAHRNDLDHVVTLFQQNGRWGAISKSNHSVLRWRDPVYKSVRELAMSYFHEYYLDDGTKSLQSFSAAFDLRRFGTGWITSQKHLWKLGTALDRSKHYQITTAAMKKTLRKADPIERKAGSLTEWKRK